MQLDGKRSVRVTPAGVFAIGFDRDAKPQAVFSTIASASGRSAARKPCTDQAQREYDDSARHRRAAETVEPPPEQLQRILAEQKWVEQARAVDSDREDFIGGPFQWPLLQGPISGVYGSQRFYNGKAGRPHFGVDVAAPVGTEVRAPADATVTLGAAGSVFFRRHLDHGSRLRGIIHLYASQPLAG